MAREIPVVVGGEAIEAAHQNTVQERIVQRYADQTALDAAVPAPGTGEIVALTATGVVQFYDGSSWIILADAAGFVPITGGTFTGAVTVALGTNQFRILSTNVDEFDEVRLNMNGGNLNVRVGNSSDFVNMLALNRGADSVTVRRATNAIVSQYLGGSNTWFMQPVFDTTSGNAANVRVNADGGIRQSTSSRVYKTSVKAIKLEDARAAVRSLRGVSFRSKIKTDDTDLVRIGFISEEVGAVIAAETDEGGYDVRSIVAYLVRIVQDLIEEAA